MNKSESHRVGRLSGSSTACRRGPRRMPPAECMINLADEQFLAEMEPQKRAEGSSRPRRDGDGRRSNGDGLPMATPQNGVDGAAVGFQMAMRLTIVRRVQRWASRKFLSRLGARE
jgi:hypothetical protein